jgi:hypothetical protein
MCGVTYSLQKNQSNSEQYYRDVAVLTKEVLEHGETILLHFRLGSVVFYQEFLCSKKV